MKFELTELDKKIIREIQKGLPVCSKPFKIIADKIGMEEEDLIEKIKFYKETGVIRRFGARINHHKSGYSENIMTVWNVPEENLEEIGTQIASYGQVSHCYARPPLKDFPYNLYSMIHGKEVGECEEVIKKISEKTGITDYKKLTTKEEYKKTAPLYFSKK